MALYTEGRPTDTVTFYADRTDLPDGLRHVIPLFPFWGGPADRHHFADLMRLGTAFLCRTSDPQAAEVFLLPFDGSELIGPPHTRRDALVRAAQQFVDRAESFGRKTVVIVNSDHDDPLPLSGDVVVLRTSLCRSNRLPNEFALPAGGYDLLGMYCDGKPCVREKRSAPRVGFCGWALDQISFRRRSREAVRRVAALVHLRIGRHRDGLYLRSRAMQAVRDHCGIETNFVVRNTYRAGITDRSSAQDHEAVRREYVGNLIDSDYVLCVRGCGNYSFRFFEALCLGRIPLLVDTDCVLPLESMIDYGKHCVIVPAAQLARLPEAVLEFHGRLSDDGFRQVQLANRRLWEDYLSPTGFYRHWGVHWRTKAA